MSNTIHIESLGFGPNLVMLHGWAMHSGVWCNVRDRLATRYRLHLVDLPGHGHSTACSTGTLQQMVKTIANVLPENCIVCGWSLGGQIAIELALQELNKIKKLVLIATNPCFVARPNWPSGMDMATLQIFRKNLEQNYVATINRFLSLQLSGSNNRNSVLAQLRKNFYQYSQPNIGMLQIGLDILLTSDLRKKMTRIKQTVLLLQGENDVITPTAAAEWMQQQIPQSKLALIPGCGHAPFLSHPDQFISSLYGL